MVLNEIGSVRGRRSREVRLACELYQCTFSTERLKSLLYRRESVNSFVDTSSYGFTSLISGYSYQLPSQALVCSSDHSIVMLFCKGISRVMSLDEWLVRSDLRDTVAQIASNGPVQVARHRIPLNTHTGHQLQYQSFISR